MRDGTLPDGAPQFDRHLPYDLLSHGLALLDHALRLDDPSLERPKGAGDADATLAERGYRTAADALASAVTNTGPDDPDHAFHRLVASCAYHFARLAARAYSLVGGDAATGLLSPGGAAIARLVVRDVSGLRELIFDTLDGGTLDERIARNVNRMAASDDADDTEVGTRRAAVIDAALTDHFLRAVAVALQAFDRGDVAFVDDAVTRLTRGLEIAADAALIEQWWLHRLAIRLLRDLWQDSFHARLPLRIGPFEDAARAREVYITSLLCRDRAEIGLWPSQIEAAERAFDTTDHMVVALPTSAGKTRIAELCILAALTEGTRVVFVTPLRSLSAQTETSLRRTFGPLGARVSALYGAAGDAGSDHELLSDEKIVVATPEKLDFALRSDPNLLDDVGLVILDEGHMIGTGQREVRYEVQVQRLLRRYDAHRRRIVCLSAVLPPGEALDDFTEWLTGHAKAGRIESAWRPTELRFGEVQWFAGTAPGHARLVVDVPGQDTFVPRFVEGRVPPSGKRKKPFPADQRELCLATAWRFLEEGRTALIFCPQRRSVEPYATSIVDLHRRGALSSVFRGDSRDLDAALAIGREWFGPDSNVVACLKLGVAIHHGSLPAPFRRELDRLIAAGVLPLVIASPTLAQGLNLAASVLIFHGLRRGQELLDAAEFRNVVGRAGRAYVDTEGLVLLPTYKGGGDRRKRQTDWKALIEDRKGREMRSGLARIVFVLFNRLQRQAGLKNLGEAVEYIANADAWTVQRIPGEKDADWEAAQRKWAEYLDSLDTAILALVGEDDAESTHDVAALLDDVLASSLWSRTLAGLKPEASDALTATLQARTRHVFEATTSAQRRFFFLAGLGLSSGHAIDDAMATLGPELLRAEGALLASEVQEVTTAVVRIAQVVFTIPPFEPNDLRDDWKRILATWIAGDPLPHTDGDKIPRFVEDAFVYRLVWALEVIRLRCQMPGALDIDGVPATEFAIGQAALTVEMGTPHVEDALLLRHGLGSREAARAAVNQASTGFETEDGLRRWLRSREVRHLERRPAWPTRTTRAIWKAFRANLEGSRTRKWRAETTEKSVEWSGDVPPPRTALSLRRGDTGRAVVYSADVHRLGVLTDTINLDRDGLTVAQANTTDGIVIRYLGPPSEG